MSNCTFEFFDTIANEHKKLQGDFALKAYLFKGGAEALLGDKVAGELGIPVLGSEKTSQKSNVFVWNSDTKSSLAIREAFDNQPNKTTGAWIPLTIKNDGKSLDIIVTGGKLPIYSQQQKGLKEPIYTYTIIERNGINYANRYVLSGRNEYTQNSGGDPTDKEMDEWAKSGFTMPMSKDEHYAVIEKRHLARKNDIEESKRQSDNEYADDLSPAPIESKKPSQKLSPLHTAINNGNVNTVLNHIITNSTTPLHQILANKLIGQLPDGINISVADTLKNKRGTEGVMNYDYSTKTVSVNLAVIPKLKESATEKGFIHELIHAVTGEKINAIMDKDESTLTKDERIARTQLKLIANLIGKHVEKSGITGDLKTVADITTTNLRELITYGLTEPAFQKMLADINIGKDKTAWTQFVHAVAKLLGIELNEEQETALSALLMVGDSLLGDTTSNTNKGESVSATYELQGNKKQPYEMSEAEFNVAYPQKYPNGKLSKSGEWVNISFKSEDELSNYINSHIAKGESFETQKGYYDGMKNFADKSGVTWYVDHELHKDNNYGVSAFKGYREVINEAVNDGKKVHSDAKDIIIQTGKKPEFLEQSQLNNQSGTFLSSTPRKIADREKANEDFSKSQDYDYKFNNGDRVVSRYSDANYIVTASYIENGQAFYNVYTVGKKSSDAHKFRIKEDDLVLIKPSKSTAQESTQPEIIEHTTPKNKISKSARQKLYVSLLRAGFKERYSSETPIGNLLINGESYSDTTILKNSDIKQNFTIQTIKDGQVGRIELTPHQLVKAAKSAGNPVFDKVDGIGSIKPSKSTPSTNTYTKTTLTSALRTVMDREYGSGFMTRLFDTGKFEVVSRDEADKVVGGGEFFSKSRNIEYETTTTTDNGNYFETGKAVTFNYAHNNQSATKIYGKPKKDSNFGRYFEPSGEYVSAIGKIPNKSEQFDNMEYGTITFKNPLVIKNNSLNWKEQLSKTFGNKRGKNLSIAVINAGYDGIVTVDKYGTSEIVNLQTFDESKAKYSKDGSIQAFYNPANDTTYFVADNIDRNKDLLGLARHEIGVHALQLGKNDAEFYSIMEQMLKIARISKPAKQALATALESFGITKVPEQDKPELVKDDNGKVIASVTREQVLHELGGYIVEHHPKLGIVQKFLAWFKSKLRAMGKALPKLEQLKLVRWVNSLNESDLVFMASSALRNAPNDLMFDNAGHGGEAVKLSESNAIEIDKNYFDAVERGDMVEVQRLVNNKLAKQGAYWHGTPSGSLQGGISGLHVGTKQAAMEALEARIGIPADGKGWNGDREYEKTLLAGKNKINSGVFGKYRLTGFNASAPENDYYPSKMPTVGNNVPVDPTWKPWLRPVLITGKMDSKVKTDRSANQTMKKRIEKGKIDEGFYYVNEGEDYGSVSAVLPSGNFVKVKLPDPITYDDNGDIIPLSQRFDKSNNDIRYSKSSLQSKITDAIDAEWLNIVNEMKLQGVIDIRC